MYLMFFLKSDGGIIVCVCWVKGGGLYGLSGGGVDNKNNISRF